MNPKEIIEIKEIVELNILQQIVDATEASNTISINGIKVVEGADGKKYNLDKIRERCSYLFNKFVKQYVV